MTTKIQRFVTGLLLSSTFFVGTQSSCLSAKTQAEPPALKIGGHTSVVAVMANQQRTDNGMGGSDPHIAIGASELYFEIKGKATTGLEYKDRIHFESIPGASMYINKNYIEFNDTFGTIQGGDRGGEARSASRHKPQGPRRYHARKWGGFNWWFWWYIWKHV